MERGIYEQVNVVRDHVVRGVKEREREKERGRETDRRTVR